MSKIKVVFNAANLHVGGGVQVATSLINELSVLPCEEIAGLEISIVCSTKVFKNLCKDLSYVNFTSFEVFDLCGFEITNKEAHNHFNGYDCCFTVFGPIYFKPRVSKHICGFAQPWIAYPINDVYQKLPLHEYIKNKIKFKIQSFFFKKYNHLVVEQSHVKRALIKLGYPNDDISIASNSVSSLYSKSRNWKPLTFDFNQLKQCITLGFIGRPYTHKNIKILSEASKILISKYQLNCNFLFTFTDDEMLTSGFSSEPNFYSIGEICAAQCPAFYQLIDALIFPSLLECFSASPIEAMKMNTTVLASKYPFVEEVCGDAAFYFDPLDAENIADAIYNAFSNPQVREEKRKLGSNIINNLPTARDRAKSYLNIIKNNI